MAFNIVTTKRVPCFGQYDRIDDFTTGELRGDKRPAFRQFLVDEFHVSAVCKCFDPLFIRHFRILSVLRFSRSIEERPVGNYGHFQKFHTMDTSVWYTSEPGSFL